MSAVDKIEVALRKKFLALQLVIIPATGATDEEIRMEENFLGRALCPDHCAILRRWNGISLEIVRLFGCGENTGEIGRIAEFQLLEDKQFENLIAVGSDASGFTYFQAMDRRVFSFDADGGDLKQVADSLDDFFERIVFGPDAAIFGGRDWLEELRAAGVVS